MTQEEKKEIVRKALTSTSKLLIELNNLLDNIDDLETFMYILNFRNSILCKCNDLMKKYDIK